MLFFLPAVLIQQLIWLYIVVAPFLCLVCALLELIHQATLDLKASIKTKFSNFTSFLKNLSIFYSMQKSQLQFLHEIGFLDVQDLTHSDNLVHFAENNEDGNDFWHHTKVPEMGLTGLFGCRPGDPSHHRISSAALEQMWEALSALGVELLSSYFVDFGKVNIFFVYYVHLYLLIIKQDVVLVLRCCLL